MTRRPLDWPFPVRVIQLDLTVVVTAAPPTTNFVAPLHEVPL